MLGPYSSLSVRKEQHAPRWTQQNIYSDSGAQHISESERERWLQKDIEKLEGSGISQPLQETKESNQERSKLAILTNVITPKPDLHG